MSKYLEPILTVVLVEKSASASEPQKFDVWLFLPCSNMGGNAIFANNRTHSAYSGIFSSFSTWDGNNRTVANSKAYSANEDL